MLGDNDAAIEWHQKSLEGNPGLNWTCACLAMAYAHNGQEANARCESDLKSFHSCPSVFHGARSGTSIGTVRFGSAMAWKSLVSRLTQADGYLAVKGVRLRHPAAVLAAALRAMR